MHAANTEGLAQTEWKEGTPLMNQKTVPASSLLFLLIFFLLILPESKAARVAKVQDISFPFRMNGGRFGNHFFANMTGNFFFIVTHLISSSLDSTPFYTTPSSFLQEFDLARSSPAPVSGLFVMGSMEDGNPYGILAAPDRFFSPIDGG